MSCDKTLLDVLITKDGGTCPSCRSPNAFRNRTTNYRHAATNWQREYVCGHCKVTINVGMFKEDPQDLPTYGKAYEVTINHKGA